MRCGESWRGFSNTARVLPRSVSTNSIGKPLELDLVRELVVLLRAAVDRESAFPCNFSGRAVERHAHFAIVTLRGRIR